MKNLIYYFFFYLRYVIKYIFLLIKFLNLINFSCITQLDSNISLNENDDIEKKKNLNSIMILTFPLRQLFYIWLSLKISENISEDIDVNNIINIIFIIEIIDKSITDAINENESLNDNLEDNKDKEIKKDLVEEVEEKKENIDK